MRRTTIHPINIFRERTMTPMIHSKTAVGSQLSRFSRESQSSHPEDDASATVFGRVETAGAMPAVATGGVALCSKAAGAVEPPAVLSMAVAIGRTNITNKPMHATAYRTLAALRPSIASTRLVIAPVTAPCQIKCANAQPIEWATLPFIIVSSTVFLLLSVI